MLIDVGRIRRRRLVPRATKPRESFLRWFLAKQPSVAFSGLHLQGTPVVNAYALGWIAGPGCFEYVRLLLLQSPR